MFEFYLAHEYWFAAAQLSLAMLGMGATLTAKAITTLACLITTPIILNLLISQHMPVDFVMPVGRIAFEITLFLLIPLIIGMVIYSKLPNHADKISKVGIYGSIFVILLIVIGSAGAGRLDLARFGIANVLVILVFALTLMCLSILIPRLLCVGTKDGTAIQIEVTVRNTNLGLLLTASLFPPGEAMGGTVLMSVLLYGAIMLLLGAGLIVFNRRVHRIG